MKPVELLIVLGKVIMYLSDTAKHHQSLINSDPIKSNYDYIVVGAGSAGSVVANRLSEEGNNSVLLLEAGGAQNFLSDIPMLWLTNAKSDIDWVYVTEPMPNAAYSNLNQAAYWPRGKVMGGSSSLNALLYVRGSPDDFNNWEKLGAKGWNWDNLLPYFVRAEGDQDTQPQDGKKGTWGKKGPQSVSTIPMVNPISKVRHFLLRQKLTQ